MSDQRQQPPLTIRPAASRRLLLYLLIVHVSALVVLAMLPVHWAPRLLLGLLVAASVVYSVWAQVLHRAPWSIVEAVWKLRLAYPRVDDAANVELASAREALMGEKK